jgi:hypothetical protein
VHLCAGIPSFCGVGQDRCRAGSSVDVSVVQCMGFVVDNMVGNSEAG